MKCVVGSVPYTNARPLIHALSGKVEVKLAVPSALPAMLDDGQADAVMVSSFDALSKSGRCFAQGCSISSFEDAESVRMFSKVPFGKVKTLALDESSLTSNHLAQIILADRHRTRPQVRYMQPELNAMLSACDACVLIGDNGMTADGLGLHVMDLGCAWAELAALPFVWALWVGRAASDSSETSLSPELVTILNESRAWGQQNLEVVVEEAQKRNRWPLAIVRRYLTDTMNYDLTDEHLQGLRLFRSLLVKHGFMENLPFPPVVRSEAVPVA